MKVLWAPWRMEYIKQLNDVECIFCTLPSQKKDEQNRILFRGSYCFIIMNAYPYSNGHLMVSPYRHISCLTNMNENEMKEIGALTQNCITILNTYCQAQGFNIGLNIGKAGGAGFDEHIHNHIVPRWPGDTNFMPVLTDTKVQPEYLQEGYDKLIPHFKRISL